MESIRDRLWTHAVGPGDYSEPGDKYQSAVLEQYRIYVEMADRASGRRALTNTFFLTLNTAVFAAFGLVQRGATPDGDAWVLVVPLVALLGQCGAWFYLVRSYRQLNSAKFIVIGALEERLPASPYWRAEWTALGEGRDRRRYWPLTHLEQWIPSLFAATYVAGFVIAVAR